MDETKAAQNLMDSYRPYSATLLADMSDRITHLQSQLRDMEQMRDEAGRRYVAQVQECTTKDRMLNELEKELEQTREQRDRWKAEFDHFKPVLEARIAELEADLTATQNRFESSSELAVELGCENSELKDRIHSLEAALREIAEHPHCMDGKCKAEQFYDRSAIESGCACGHRCCAEIARKALEK